MFSCSISSMRHSSLIFILILVSYCLLMFGNGIVSLTHPDEVFYVQTAKEMIAKNSWLTPYIFDEPQFEKPIFFFWLLAAGIKWFGMSAFVARFWPAFFGMLGVVTTYWVSWMLFEKKRISFLSGLILSTSFIYIALSRAILTDMVFSILVLISLAFFYYGYRYQHRKNFGIVMSFVFSGIAVLAKGLLGVCFPSAIILGFLLVNKDIKFLKCRALLLGIFLFAIVAVPWHVHMFKLYGQVFIDEYFYNVHIRRLLVAEHAKCDNWYFYPGLMLAGVMPWSVFLIPAVAGAVSQIKDKANNHRAQLLFLFIWIFGIFIFIQFAHSKLASYIFPVYPALAIIIGYYLGNCMENNKNRIPKTIKIAGYFLAAAMAIASVSSVIYAKMNLDIVVNMFPAYAFALVLFAMVLAIVFSIKFNKFMKMICSISGITVALLTGLFLGRPSIEPWVSCEEISSILKTIDKTNSTVLSSKFYVRGVRFYTDRKMAVIDINGKGFFSPHPIPFLNTYEKVVEFLESQPLTYAVVKKGDLEQLERIADWHGYTLTHFENVGGKYIVKIEKQES